MSSVPEDVLAEAKRLTESLISQGKLLSPRDAWLLSGETKDAQTLWSVAFGLAMRTDTSAEEIDLWLEEKFPQYAKVDDGSSSSSSEPEYGL
jgi:hypothetical protein